MGFPNPIMSQEHNSASHTKVWFFAGGFAWRKKLNLKFPGEYAGTAQMYCRVYKP